MIEGTEMVWIAFIGFLAGLALVGGALFKKQVGWNIHPVAAFVVGVALVVVGGMYSIPNLLPAAEEDVDDDTDDGGNTIVINPSGQTATIPTFNIECTNGSGHANVTAPTISEDDTEVTVPLDVSADSDTLSNSKYLSLNFTVTPIPPDDATADSLATVYFETDYDMKYGGEYVLSEAADTYFANWTYKAGSNGADTQDYASSMSMLVTSNGWAEIDYCFSDDSTDSFCQELDSIGDSGTWDITFHNSDWSWSHTTTVTWIVIDVS